MVYCGIFETRISAIFCYKIGLHILCNQLRKVQVGNDQERAHSNSKNRGGKKLNQQSGTYAMKTYRKPNEQPFSQ